MKPLLPSPQRVGQWALEEGQTIWQQAAGRSDWRVFAVQAPLTVFVRATQCKVAIRFHDLDQVEIHTHFYNAFGLRFVAQQDEAGVYFVLMRRRFWGWIASAECLLKIPAYANLALHLSQGEVQFQAVNGQLNLPPIVTANPNGPFYDESLGATIVLK
jgi:hypothetical protein